MFPNALNSLSLPALVFSLSTVAYTALGFLVLGYALGRLRRAQVATTWTDDDYVSQETLEHIMRRERKTGQVL